MAVEVRFVVRERDLGSALDVVMSLPLVGELTADHARGAVRETETGAGSFSELERDLGEEAVDEP
jgi:hypothetical protein